MTRRPSIMSRAQVAPFELVIALLLVLSGVRFIWHREELETSQIGQTLPFPELWAACYLSAGVLLIVGVLMPLAKMEAAGLALMASVVTINAIAFAATYNLWEQWAYGVAFVFYLSLAVAACARLRVLLRGGLIARVADEHDVTLHLMRSDGDGH